MNHSIRNKKRFGMSAALCAVIAMLNGCALQDVVEKGEACPPKGADPDAVLAYINSPEVCASDDEFCIYKSAFTDRVCPVQFKHCMPLNDLRYYCAESDKCPEGSYRCDGKCFSPESDDTCGIREDCSGGVKCADNESCVRGDNGYRCTKSVQEICSEDHITIKENGTVKCIDPNSNKTCGATSEDDLGVECSDREVCRSGECQCQGDYYECNGKCVSPREDEYCGISENCSDEKKIVNCVDLSNEKNEPYKCTQNFNENKYECQLNCPDGKNPCDGKCVDKLNDEHCNVCGNSCLHTQNNTKIGKCVEDTDNNYKCEFECETGYDKCGDKCVDKKMDPDNCGGCGTQCNKDQVCDNGACIEAKCQGNDIHKCFTVDSGCIESTLKCGPSCNPCGAGQVCTSGICHDTSCTAGQHMEYNLVNHTAKCVANSNVACAPNNNKITDAIHDCVKESQNAATVSCDAGKCVIRSCATNYHLKDGKCVPDTKLECGNSLTNCENIANSASVICQSGSCKVQSCKLNYHLYGNSCEYNDTNNCGSHGHSCVVANGLTYRCNTDASNKAACIVSSCTFAYHPDALGKECVIDTMAECGSYSNACDTSKYKHCIIYRDKSRCGNCNLNEVNNVIKGGKTGGRCYVMHDKCDDVEAGYQSMSSPKSYQYTLNRACRTVNDEKGGCVLKGKTWSCDSSVYGRD